MCKISQILVLSLALSAPRDLIIVSKMSRVVFIFVIFIFVFISISILFLFKTKSVLF